MPVLSLGLAGWSVQDSVITSVAEKRFAVDDDGCGATGQRGTLRPQDGNADAVAVCDIGAYEQTHALGDLPGRRSTVAGGHAGARRAAIVCPD
jgi:hypothetical protein